MDELKKQYADLIKLLEANRYTSQFTLMSLKTVDAAKAAIAEGRLLIVHDGDAVAFVGFLSSSHVLHVQGQFLAAVSEPLRKLVSSKRIERLSGPTGLVNSLLANKLFPKPKEKTDDVVYHLDLKKNAHVELHPDFHRLSKTDFEAWYNLYMDYFTELGFSSTLSKDERRKKFEYEIDQGWHWGGFINEELISIAAYNSQTDSSAQIGGVYTPPGFRGRGFSQKTMERLIYDSKAVPGLEELVLYTGDETTVPARVYLRVGFVPVDRYSSVAFT